MKKSRSAGDGCGKRHGFMRRWAYMARPVVRWATGVVGCRMGVAYSCGSFVPFWAVTLKSSFAARLPRLLAGEPVALAPSVAELVALAPDW